MKKYKIATIIDKNDNNIKIHWLAYSSKWDEIIHEKDYKDRIKVGKYNFRIKKNDNILMKFEYNKDKDISVVKMHINDGQCMEFELRQNYYDWVPYIEAYSSSKEILLLRCCNILTLLFVARI